MEIKKWKYNIAVSPSCLSYYLIAYLSDNVVVSTNPHCLKGATATGRDVVRQCRVVCLIPLLRKSSGRPRSVSDAA